MPDHNFYIDLLMVIITAAVGYLMTYLKQLKTESAVRTVKEAEAVATTVVERHVEAQEKIAEVNKKAGITTSGSTKKAEASVGIRQELESIAKTTGKSLFASILGSISGRIESAVLKKLPGK
jgi:hypothetical protein